MKLVNLKGSTYMIDAFNRIGLYLYNDNEVAVIDTGLDDAAGQAIMDECEKQGWQIKMIINTHAHPDHMGGNFIISKTLEVPVYVHGLERVMYENPQLGPTIMYGGYPHKIMRGLFLREPIKTLPLTNDILPEGLEFILLPGHNSDMVGIKTKDGVYFLADGITGEDLITKYQLQFMFNIKEYLKTLDYISDLKGDIFVPSHGAIANDIKSLTELNKNIILGVVEKIKTICKDGLSFDDILKELVEIYHIKLEFMQYSMISFTLRCYLSYMLDEKLIGAEFISNKLIWKTL